MIKIKKMGLFATPKTTEHITNFIQALPKDEQYVGWTIMGMTWNYMASKISGEENEDEALCDSVSQG